MSECCNFPKIIVVKTMNICVEALSVCRLYRLDLIVEVSEKSIKEKVHG